MILTSRKASSRSRDGEVMLFEYISVVTLLYYRNTCYLFPI